MGGKNSKHVNIQQTLDLTKFWVHKQSQSQTKLSYRLVSLVSHIGPSTNCGHYTAIGNTASGQFYLFDDSSVSQRLTGRVDVLGSFSEAKKHGGIFYFFRWLE